METLWQLLLDNRYLVLLGVALLEGPVASFVAGTMVALGHLNPLGALAILVFKDLVLDTAFYAIGKYGSQVPFTARLIQKTRSGTGLASNLLASIEEGWRDHPIRWMWVGKLAYGLSAWFLISAGLAGLSFTRFLLYALPVTFFQFGVLMTLGYVLGSSLGDATMHAFTWMQLGAAAMVVFFGMQALTRFIRKKSLQN